VYSETANVILLHVVQALGWIIGQGIYYRDWGWFTWYSSATQEEFQDIYRNYVHTCSSTAICLQTCNSFVTIRSTMRRTCQSQGAVLTILTPSRADGLDIQGTSTSCSPKGLSTSVTGLFYLYLYLPTSQYIYIYSLIHTYIHTRSKNEKWRWYQSCVGKHVYVLAKFRNRWTEVHWWQLNLVCVQNQNCK
jgi:hypothetical protein